MQILEGSPSDWAFGIERIVEPVFLEAYCPGCGRLTLVDTSFDAELLSDFERSRLEPRTYTRLDATLLSDEDACFAKKPLRRQLVLQARRSSSA